MPATSQKQEKFMNFVHATQKGEASAKGYPKVEAAAKEMKPNTVEHFMGRGHIDKDLPKRADYKDKLIRLKLRQDPDNMESTKQAGWYEKFRKDFDGWKMNGHFKKEDHDKLFYHNDEKPMNKKAFDRGFVKAAMANGASPLEAVQLLKLADDFWPALAGMGLAGGLGAAVGAHINKKHRAKGALIGGAVGAGTGILGGAGVLAGRAIDKKHPVRGAVIGGALGATLPVLALAALANS